MDDIRDKQIAILKRKEENAKESEEAFLASLQADIDASKNTKAAAKAKKVKKNKPDTSLKPVVANHILNAQSADSVAETVRAPVNDSHDHQIVSTLSSLDIKDEEDEAAGFTIVEKRSKNRRPTQQNAMVLPLKADSKPSKSSDIKDLASSKEIVCPTSKMGQSTQHSKKTHTPKQPTKNKPVIDSPNKGKATALSQNRNINFNVIKQSIEKPSVCITSQLQNVKKNKGLLTQVTNQIADVVDIENRDSELTRSNSTSIIPIMTDEKIDNVSHRPLPPLEVNSVAEDKSSTLMTHNPSILETDTAFNDNMSQNPYNNTEQQKQRQDKKKYKPQHCRVCHDSQNFMQQPRIVERVVYMPYAVPTAMPIYNLYPQMRISYPYLVNGVNNICQSNSMGHVWQIANEEQIVGQMGPLLRQILVCQSCQILTQTFHPIIQG